MAWKSVYARAHTDTEQPFLQLRMSKLTQAENPLATKHNTLKHKQDTVWTNKS
jgi:hypothetical protein